MRKNQVENIGCQVEDRLRSLAFSRYTPILLLIVLVAGCGGGGSDEGYPTEDQVQGPVCLNCEPVNQEPDSEDEGEPFLDFPDIPHEEWIEDGRQILGLDARLEPEAVREIVNTYECTDEREQAMSYESHHTAIANSWDGTPFVVDVADDFFSDFSLLGLIEDEAARIKDALGYEIFIAGEVTTLESIDPLRALPHDFGSFAPDGRIEIRCCVRYADGYSGYAVPAARVIVLGQSYFDSEFALIHELYHLLGFVHPGESPGIVMSEPLNQGVYNNDPRSAALDLARLACAYDRMEER